MSYIAILPGDLRKSLLFYLSRWDLLSFIEKSVEFGLSYYLTEKFWAEKLKQDFTDNTYGPPGSIGSSGYGGWVGTTGAVGPVGLIGTIGPTAPVVAGGYMGAAGNVQPIQEQDKTPEWLSTTNKESYLLLKGIDSSSFTYAEKYLISTVCESPCHDPPSYFIGIMSNMHRYKLNDYYKEKIYRTYFDRKSFLIQYLAIRVCYGISIYEYLIQLYPQYLRFILLSIPRCRGPVLLTNVIEKLYIKYATQLGTINSDEYIMFNYLSDTDLEYWLFYKLQNFK